MDTYEKTNAITRRPLLNNSDPACLCKLITAPGRGCPTEANKKQPERRVSTFSPAAAPLQWPSNSAWGRGIKDVLPTSLGWTCAAGSSVWLFKDKSEAAPYRALWRGIKTSVDNTSLHGPQRPWQGGPGSQSLFQWWLPRVWKMLLLVILRAMQTVSGAPQTQAKFAVKSLYQPSAPWEATVKGSKPEAWDQFTY